LLYEQNEIIEWRIWFRLKRSPIRIVLVTMVLNIVLFVTLIIGSNIFWGYHVLMKSQLFS